MYTAEEQNRSLERDWILAVGSVLKEIAESDTLGIDYVAICACALEFLDGACEQHYDFPIDIDLLVRKVGIEVTYLPLNADDVKNIGTHKIVGKYMKKRNYITQEITNVVYVEERASRAEQRYALAHALAHFLIHSEDVQYSSEYRVMPMLFKKMDEMVADIFAIFILIPLPVFLTEFKFYIAAQSEPVQTSEWLKYLCLVSEVPYEDVAIGYQNIRYVCAVIYQIANDEREVNWAYGDINYIIEKQINKLSGLIGEPDIVERLFC